MTKEEAIKELAELEPMEKAAWQKCEEADKATKQANAEWQPIYTRKQNLKTFIELSSNGSTADVVEKLQAQAKIPS